LGIEERILKAKDMRIPKGLRTFFLAQQGKRNKKNGRNNNQEDIILAEMELHMRLYNAMPAIHMAITLISAQESQKEVVCKWE